MAKRVRARCRRAAACRAQQRVCSGACLHACTPATELFAIIKTTEKLEQAFGKGALKDDEYTEACYQLITHYKMYRKRPDAVGGSGLAA